MLKKLSAPRYLLGLIVGLMGLQAAVLAIPHDPYIRWQSFSGTLFERTKHHYERLHFDPAPVDVIFVGSSRTAAVVDPELLEANLAERGAPLRVVDLSLPASGMDIRVAQIREALAARPETKLLVFAVVEALPRDGHQAFGDLAEVRDVLGSPLLINRNLPATILRLPMRQVKLGAASLFPEAFGYKGSFDPANYLGSAYDYTGGTERDQDFNYLSAEHEADLAAESDRRKSEITAPLFPERFADVEFGLSRSSIETVLRLAKANGTEVAFLFLPFYNGYEEPRDAAWLRARGPLWAAQWMRTDPSFYRDAAHASPLAVGPANTWLADQITRQLSAVPAQAPSGQKVPR